MRSKKRTIGILIVVIVVLLGFAGSLLVYRNKLSSEKTKNNSNNNTAQSLSSAPSGKSIENFYDKPITDEKIALDSIEANRDKLGYSDKSFTFIYDEKSGSKTAYHFDLYYKDIPVYSPVGIRGVSVITYYDNSADVLITGVSNSEKITKINTIPKITQDELKDIIKRQFSIEEDINSKLIVYETSEEYVLAYYIEYSFYIYIINAENGEIIDSSSMLVSNSAEYEGQNGDIHQIFYNDYTDETKDIKNALWDNEKNIFIVNNRWGYELFGKKSSEGLFTTEDLKLGNNKSAIDGMANAYRAVEFFEKKFDYTFDSTYVSVNVDKDKDKKGNTKKDNACGTYAKVNDDSIAYLFFLVSSDKDKAQWTAYLDLVAHEYTHAITGSKAFGTGYSKDSKYYEKNALTEAYSDIFGELVEKEYTGSTDWKNYNLRNISEPKIKKYTERYITEDKQGTENNDYGGAHRNSTIISHVAYLISKSNDSKKYDAEFLLDYNQLAQLWYGSLEYLKKTEFKDFADCRYAVEKSARKLIEEGVLLEDNLKVIEQAFNEVEVSSNPARRGAMDSAEIKEKHTLVVPIEDETQSSEPVEIEELNYADVIISQYKNVVKGSNILGIDKVGLIDIDLDGELEFAVFSFGKRNSNDARNSNHFDFYDINTENNTLDLIELSEDTGADAIKLKLYQDNNGNKFYIGYNFTSWFGESMIKIQYIDGKINIETLARNEWDLRYIIKESEKWREATKEEYYNYTSQFTELENNFITENYETFNNMSNSEKESFLLQN